MFSFSFWLYGEKLYTKGACKAKLGIEVGHKHTQTLRIKWCLKFVVVNVETICNSDLTL
jgi:hypothetical protein